jgi:hypothetical protein
MLAAPQNDTKLALAEKSFACGGNTLPWLPL